jgi:hypothetical protein
LDNSQFTLGPTEQHTLRGLTCGLSRVRAGHQREEPVGRPTSTFAESSCMRMRML